MLECQSCEQSEKFYDLGLHSIDNEKNCLVTRKAASRFNREMSLLPLSVISLTRHRS